MLAFLLWNRTHRITFWRSLSPSSRPNIESISIIATCSSGLFIAPRLWFKGFLIAGSTALFMLCIPVHPINATLSGTTPSLGSFWAREKSWYFNSTTTFWVIYCEDWSANNKCSRNLRHTALALRRAVTRTAGRFARQFFSEGRNTTCACKKLFSPALSESPITLWMDGLWAPYSVIVYKNQLTSNKMQKHWTEVCDKFALTELGTRIGTRF